MPVNFLINIRWKLFYGLKIQSTMTNVSLMRGEYDDIQTTMTKGKSIMDWSVNKKIR